MSENVLNIVVSGVGGQGTVLAGKLIAQCALDNGAFVRSAETIGMSQRGGSVLGHVRIVDQEDADCLSSPLVPPKSAQVLIGFEPAETLRALSFCAPGAVVVTATKPLAPPTASLQRLEYDGSKQLRALEQAAETGELSLFLPIENDVIMAELGFDKALNVVLLGAALGALETTPFQRVAPLHYPAMRTTIETMVKKRFVEPNLQALKMGYQLVCT